MSVEATRKGVKFDQPLTDAQKRRAARGDGCLVAHLDHAERHPDGSVDVSVDRVRG